MGNEGRKVPNRDKVIIFRVTDQEKQAIETLAWRQGRPVAALLRDFIREITGIKRDVKRREDASADLPGR